MQVFMNSTAQQIFRRKDGKISGNKFKPKKYMYSVLNHLRNYELWICYQVRNIFSNKPTVKF